MSRFLFIASLLTVAAACGGTKSEVPDNPTKEVEVAVSDTDFQEIPVEFSAAGMTIYGSVTRPAGEGRFPALIVAAGSGPTDRDWNNKLLPGANGSGKLLANELAARGIAVLRYDKRGTGKTGMPSAPVTWGDYVAELSAGLSKLAEQPFVDKQRIHLAGHSEGGAHALRAAEKPPVPIASVILLSTAGRSLGDIVIWQIGNQIRQSSLNEAAADAEIAAIEGAIAKIAAGETVEPTTVGQLPGVQQFIAALQSPDSVDFARELLVFDPKASFEKVNAPVLILSGARDIQVAPEHDAKPLHEAALAAGREAKLEIIEHADHVLKYEEKPRAELTAQTGLDYNKAGRELDPAVVEALASWIE